MKHVLAVFFIMMIVGIFVGCGAGGQEVGDTASTPTVDVTDPQQVAEVFWTAVIKDDFEAASRFVKPADRESFMTDAREELKNLPPFPEKPVIKALEEGNGWIAVIENWEIKSGPDMVLEEGQWWIER